MVPPDDARAGTEGSAAKATAQISDTTSSQDISAGTPQKVLTTTLTAKANAGISAIACDPCRKRKLKCDRVRPVCSSCTRAAVECKYETLRRKTGPRKGHLKHLYDRLAQMETLLQNSDGVANDAASLRTTEHSNRQSSSSKSPSPPANSGLLQDANGAILLAGSEQLQGTIEPMDQLLSDMISLDIEDLPPLPEVIIELDELFFRNIYQTIPIFHKQRFLARRDFTLVTGHLKGLRYAMWALSCDSSTHFAPMQEDFYRKARKNLLAYDNRSGAELEQCQAWLMVTVFEFMKLDMTMAWMSVGRAVRLAQMLTLERLDGDPNETPLMYLPPTEDVIENEERRRTFWAVFWADQSASMGLGWPSSIRENDITTKLPDFEDAFQAGRTRLNPTLNEVFSAKVINYSALAGIAVGQILLARILNHLYLPGRDAQMQDTNGNFWRQHREIDNTLLEMGMRMPPYMRISQAYTDPFVVMHNTHWWVMTLLLHQAAMLRSKKYNLPARIFEESKTRSISAAFEITSSMRAICHLDLARLHAFTHYATYVAAKVFLAFLQDQDQNHEIMISIRFLYAMLEKFSQSFSNASLYRAQLDDDIDKCAIARSQLFPDKALGVDDGSPGAAGGIFTQLSEDRVWDPFTRLLKSDYPVGKSSSSQSIKDTKFVQALNTGTFPALTQPTITNPATLPPIAPHYVSNRDSFSLQGSAPRNAPSVLQPPSTLVQKALQGGPEFAFPYSWWSNPQALSTNNPQEIPDPIPNTSGADQGIFSEDMTQWPIDWPGSFPEDFDWEQMGDIQLRNPDIQ